MPDITDNMQTTATKAPRVVTKKQAQAILHCSRNYVEQIAAMMHVGRSTIYRCLNASDDANAE